MAGRNKTRPINKTAGIRRAAGRALIFIEANLFSCTAPRVFHAWNHSPQSVQPRQGFGGCRAKLRQVGGVIQVDRGPNFAKTSPLSNAQAPSRKKFRTTFGASTP